MHKNCLEKLNISGFDYSPFTIDYAHYFLQRKRHPRRN